MFYIESERLRLIPLTRELLLLSTTDRPAMERAMGLNVSSMVIDELYIKEFADGIASFCLPKLLEFPDRYQWYSPWEIIRKDTSTAIGCIGFAGYPNESGEAEMGYLLDKQEQGKGYASEAFQTAIKWAFTNPEVKDIIVHTFEDNLPSRKLLTRCGFTEIEKNEENLLTYKLLK
ncbi:MAG TPA: GNAT family N-acetyltransferase [Mucilaginibacter sp.]|jgi:GNAT superfamily N-acetyltransferase